MWRQFSGKMNLALFHDPAIRSVQDTANRGLINLSSGHLESQGRQLRLVPGMLVNAEIHLGTRSVLEYLLSPVQKVAIPHPFPLSREARGNVQRVTGLSADSARTGWRLGESGNRWKSYADPTFPRLAL